MAWRDDLLHCWDLEEASGDAIDDIGGLNLHRVNAPGNTPGVVGDAVDLVRASAQNLTNPGPTPFIQEAPFSIACFFQFASIPATDVMAIFSLGASTAAGTYDYLALILSTGELLISFGGGFGGVIVHSTVLAVDTPHFLGITHNGTTLRLKVNNDAWDSVAADYGPYGSPAPFNIGAIADTSNRFDGFIDQFMIWDVAKSDADIVDVWNDGNGVACVVEEEDIVMATIPYPFECTFEDGTFAPFDTETDTESKMSVRHYSQLARMPFVDCIPYKGAYAGYVDLSLGTADAFWEETAGFDAAATTTVAFRMYFWCSQLTMAALDRFTIATLESAAGTGEATISVYCPSLGNYQFVASETGATAIGAGTRVSDLIQNAWHCLEMVSVIDAGGGNDGTLVFLVDGYQIGATITALDQAAIIHARVGAIGIDAGTTRGHLLFDDIVGDTLRVGTLSKRFNHTRYLTKTGHAILGPATIEATTLVGSAVPDEVMVMYDTDNADTTDLSRRVVVAVDAIPFQVSQGLYCVLSGTSPFAAIKVSSAGDMSAGNIKNLGNRRVIA